MVISFGAAGLPRCTAAPTFGVTLLTWPELLLQEGTAVMALVRVKFVKQLHFCQGPALLFISPKLELPWGVSPWELMRLISLRRTWSLWIGKEVTFELNSSDVLLIILSPAVQNIACVPGTTDAEAPSDLNDCCFVPPLWTTYRCGSLHLCALSFKCRQSVDVWSVRSWS